MKHLFLLLFVFVTCSLHAQIPTKTGWNVGADFGAAFNHMSTKNLSLRKGHWGFTGGITGNYTFNNNIVCETGLRFVNKGSDQLKGFDENLKKFISTMTLEKLHYLEIPIMVGYRFKLSDIVSITPKIGGYYAFGLDGKGYIENADNTFGSMIFPFEDNTFTMGDGSVGTYKALERHDGGFLVGADIQIGQAVCRIAYGRSLSPIENKYDSGNRHQTLSLSLGYYLFKKQ